MVARRTWAAWPVVAALLVGSISSPAGAQPSATPLRRDVEVTPEFGEPAPPAPVTDTSEPEPEPEPAPVVPAPAQALADVEPDEVVGVAVGLGPSAPGSKVELAVVTQLEQSVHASVQPKTRVRRLRAGVGEGKDVCNERRDDLVIQVEYLPDRDDPVLLTRDCRLDRDLAVHGAWAASEVGLVAALWTEHQALVRTGVKERRVRVSRKVRTGLIAGGAILVVGLAIGLIVGSSLRRDTVVITVMP